MHSLWSGTITFGLVSISVNLLSAVRPRRTAMKLVDKDGHALGREYHCSKDDCKCWRQPWRALAALASALL